MADYGTLFVLMKYSLVNRLTATLLCSAFWLSRFALLLSRLLLRFTFGSEHVWIAGKLWRHCRYVVWSGVVFECHRNAVLRLCSANWIVITFARWSSWKIGDFRFCVPSSAVGWTFSGNWKFTKREKRLWKCLTQYKIVWTLTFSWKSRYQNIRQNKNENF